MAAKLELELQPAVRQALVDFVFQLADDELTLGHRDSEWLGLAPDVEEDVAFSSIAQDEVGHAVYYFEFLRDLGEGDPDGLAFDRPPEARRNARLVERPNGDWAYTVLRHFLYDAWDAVRLGAMTGSCIPALAQGAAKMLREERYHRMHMEMWVTSLGQAGGEAKQRLEAAVSAIWPDLPDLLSFGIYEGTLVAEGILTQPRDTLVISWERQVRPVLEVAGIGWPGPVTVADGQAGGRHGRHGSELTELLTTMGNVHRLDPSARW
jgi:ring-1,2-phenylacetyl-CoA epoxidase subunit PaaC